MKNITRLLILSCLSLSCIMLSCSKDEDEKISVEFISQLDCGRALLPFDTNQFNNLITDSISVVDVNFDYTCMIVELAYSGCEERFIDVMAFIDYTSFAPILKAKIKNVDPLEECLAFFNHSDTFDLTSTGMELYDGMSLMVVDWNETFILDLEE